MIRFLLGLAVGIAAGVAIGLHLVYTQEPPVRRERIQWFTPDPRATWEDCCGDFGG